MLCLLHGTYYPFNNEKDMEFYAQNLLKIEVQTLDIKLHIMTLLKSIIESDYDHNKISQSRWRCPQLA